MNLNLRNWKIERGRIKFLNPNIFTLTDSGETLKKTWKLLDKSEKAAFIMNLLLQFVLSIFDVIGVLLLGALAGLSVLGISSNSPQGIVYDTLTFFRLDTYTFQTQVATLGILASIVLTSRSLLSIYVNYRFLKFLNEKASRISSKLSKNLIYQELTFIQKFTIPEHVYILTSGVTKLTVGILGNLFLVLSDSILLLLIVCGLLFVDPFMAMVTFLCFSIISIILHNLLGKKSQILGAANAKLNIESEQIIHEAILSFRETLVRNNRQFYVNNITQLQNKLANSNLLISFLPIIGKYVLEIAVIVFGLIIAAMQFLAKDAFQAISTITIFLVATSRIVPAIIRVQQSALRFKESIGSSNPTLRMISSIGHNCNIISTENQMKLSHHNFIPEIKLENIHFTYSESTIEILKGIDLSIEAGTHVAIVGPTGSGKSTLIDVILGVNKPQVGNVTISGFEPLETFSNWPGATAYVPQNVFITTGTIKSNILAGFTESTGIQDQLLKAIKKSQLEDMILNIKEGLNSPVNDRGSSLSGGQKQRIGIARALLTNPKLVVLDEATSSLDSETEKLIADVFEKMRGKITLVSVAHRLSTIRNADKVIYLERGKIIATGTFDEVRRQVPNFDNQAKLMGID